MLGLTIDLFWLSLTAVGLADRQARSYVVVLFAMWMTQEAAQVQAVGITSELIMIAADLIACTLLYAVWRRDRSWLGAVAIMMFAPSMLVQSLYWLFSICGIRMEWPLFWSATFIFTVQMAVLATPGWCYIGADVVRLLRSWSTLRSRDNGSRHVDRALAAQIQPYRRNLAQGLDA